MGWRTVVVSSPAVLSLDQNRLVVARREQPDVTVPLEDIAGVVLDHPQITVTAPLLTALRGAAAAGTAQPAAGRSALADGSVAAVQEELLEAHRAAKAAQPGPLPGDRRPARARAGARSRAQVKSGDGDNRESVAAAVTFGALFPGLKRREDGVINAALNYGYAILRACTARTLTAYGFQPALGIHHCSELNAFNLADDFLEPLRPVVDLWTFMHMRDAEQFEKEHRLALVRLLAAVVRCGGEEVTVRRACEVMCASFVGACREKDPQLLRLPELLPLRTWHE